MKYPRIFYVAFFVLSLIAIELGLHLFNFVVSLAKTNPLLSIPYYQNAPWAKGLFEQQEKLPTAFAPYTTWQMLPLRSPSINIDAHGVRQTQNPSSYSMKRPTQVYMFGGSTMWGWESRDDFTIPSWLSKTLNEKSAEYEVTNYGMPGMVFTQEEVYFAMLLRSGARPDIVVFYDGANEISSAYVAGKAGVLLDENSYARDFGVHGAKRIILGVKEVLQQQCETCHALVYLMRLVTSPSFLRRVGVQGEQYDRGSIKTLAEDTARYYRDSLDWLSKLSKEYNFKYEVFWQPTMTQESSTAAVGRERDIAPYDWTVADQNYIDFSHAVHEDTVAIVSSSPRFHDISDAFQGRTHQLYVDAVHLTEEGNQIIANRIAPFVQSIK